MKKKRCDIHFCGRWGRHCPMDSYDSATIIGLKSTFKIYKMGNTQKKKQKFTNEDLIFLKSYTRQNKELLEKWCKRFKKDCTNGEITPELLKSVCAMFFPYINENSFSNYIFKVFDSQRKGYITFKDLMLIIGNIEANNKICGATSDEKLKWAIISHDMWIVVERLNKVVNIK